MSRIALVINPSKANADLTKTLLEDAIAQAGLAKPLILETSEDDPGAGMTLAALEAGATTIIAAGGDGTVRVVAETVVRHASSVNIGIVPLGTGNLLARNLGMNVEELESAVNVAVTGTVATIDAMNIRAELRDGSETEHIGLVTTGMGLDAEVMVGIDDDLKSKLGPLAYAVQAAPKMLGLDHRHKIRFSVDGSAWETRKVRTALLANAGFIQGGIEFAPGALLDDGIQNAVLIMPRGLIGWTQVAIKTLFHPSRRVPTVEYLEGQEIVVRPFYPLEAEVDGDPIGPTVTLTSTIMPHALNVRVPSPEDRTDPAGILPKLLQLTQFSELQKLPPVIRVKRVRRKILGKFRLHFFHWLRR
ncbi:MAG: diacylglycerol/lipid kinase family protein [Galactobacter sp.]